ncbi:MAG TPA: hypothetical protein DEA55_08110 [Rhodospirillaceae bacterium]|nr:hypothetical protein [Rhodospirillaceae bacterium]
MSEVNASDRRVIESENDVFDLYLGSGANMKVGLETEISFFDPVTLKPMSLAQNKLLKNAAQARHSGVWVHTEPTADILEAISIPGKAHERKNILHDINEKTKILNGKATELGLKRSYFQELPDRTGKELLEHIVDNERYQIMYWPYREDMTDIVVYFAVCKSNQISVSYKNPDHLLRNMRRLYFLAPFLFMLTDNTSGFDQGRAFAGHSGMMHRASLKDRGGVLPYVFTARNGEDFIRKHIDAVMNNKLFMYYDGQGKLTRVPSGTWESFNALRERGLNTANNYFLAQSVLWPDVKIAALKDASGTVNGHRFEARMFGVGIHQHQTALLITSELAFNDGFAADVDALLSEYGFDANDLPSAQKTLENSYRAAREHNGKFFDITYGSGSMADFAKAFADLVENAFIGKDFDEELEPLLSICRSGCTDGKVNRILFPTFEETMRHQKNFDPAIFDDPNTCAHMVFEKELRKKSKGACCGAYA